MTFGRLDRLANGLRLVMPRTISKSAYLEVTRAYGKFQKELSGKEMPAKALVERKFEQIEDVEPEAEPTEPALLLDGDRVT